MNFIGHRLNVSTSKKDFAPVAGSASSVNSVDCACVAKQTTIESIHSSFCGELESQNAYQAKQVTEFMYQSGIENYKMIRRETYNRKKRNEKESARRPYEHMKVCKGMNKWKKSYNALNDYKLDTIFEESYKPHFGIESVASATFALDALARFANIDLPDKVVREVEGVLLLLINLTQQTTPLGVVTSVLTWAQGRTSRSVFSVLRTYIEDLLCTPQSNIGVPEWLECLRDVRQNWQLCKSNRAFAQISKLLGCLVMIGLCDVSSLTFNVGDYTLFAPSLCEKHITAFDVADAIFETVVFFAEGAYLCFQSGSLRPLLVNDRTAMEMDAEYAQIVSWFDLVKNGNLSKFAQVTDQEFEKRLNRLSTNLLNLSVSLRGFDKKLVMDKYQKILSIQNDFVAMKVASGVRHSPWAIELFGESSQGKTTLGDQLVDAVLTSQGLPIDKEYRCAYNAGDKFMSNWTSDKLVMVFDDISNDKSQFVERPPTRAIIDVINNQMYYAPKAELEAKGKCFVEPWIAIATTNKKDLDAGLYSNCPYSIQRRLVCITVKAKKEFQRIEEGISCGIDPTKVREHYTIDGVYTPPMFDDIWTITIERAVKPSQLDCVAPYRPIVWNGKMMIDISMAECIQWAIEDFDLHRRNQEAVLDSMKVRCTKMCVCGIDGCKQLQGNCYKHPTFEPHLGRHTVSSAFRLLYSVNPMKSIDHIYDRADIEFAKCLYDRGSRFLENWDWITCVPADVLDSKWALPLVQWFYRDAIKRQHMRNVSGCFAVFLFVAFWLYHVLGVVSHLVIPCLVLYLLLSARMSYDRAESEFLAELRERNMNVAPIVARCRDKYVKAICAISIGVAAVYGLARAYKAYRSNMVDAQGSLEPKTEQEVRERDAEVNVWSEVVKRPLPITDFSRRMSPEQLSNCVDKALVYGSIHLGEDTGMMNGLMLTSNVMLIPDHYFAECGDDLDCTFRKEHPEKSGGKFATRIHKKCSVLIPGTDLRVCYVPNGGSFKNLLNCFPTDNMPRVPFRMLWRKKDGDLVRAKGMSTPGVVTTIVSFNGGVYENLSIDTFQGLCGAALISDTNGSVIYGIHLGGTSGTPRGCYGSITQSQLQIAVDELRKIEGVVLSGSAGVFRTEVFGIQIMKPDVLHKKSPLNYMPKNSQVEYYGSCIGRSVSKSLVKVTPISEHIMDVCGVPNIYRGPKFNPDWYGWQTCLDNLAVPALPFPYGLLERAIIDYKTPLIKVFSSNLWNSTCPLNDKDNLCGAPGKKFLDAIKLNTSVGYPMTGPKRKFVIELDPTEDRQNNREFDPLILDEIAYVEGCYRRGERAYPIAKACKKDEILSKDKCRIFYGNAISLTFLIRKYYLPLLRVLQMNPLLSECAVGINSHGPEWDEFHHHVFKHGSHRLIGGDYGKYDQKLPAQLIFAALRILMDFARECAYTKEDLDIMEAMTGDIVYAYIAYNGDLIGLTEGAHISGNSLTVIINGICGSLNLRVCYFAMVPSARNFRDDVAVMTYGDDNIGSVREGVPFTIRVVSEFLGRFGQVYTMPDKESELVDFLPEDEFEFLKRKSVYHPVLGVHLGALLDKSIYKSLHCFMRDKNSPDTEEMACALNIDTALREWFNHGPTKYYEQRRLMFEVAQRAGISHMCSELHVTYEERCAEWAHKYGPRG